MLSAKFGRGIVTAAINIGAVVLLLGATAHAQQTGRVFPYKWVGAVPAEEITTADVQHALIWTRRYVAMADGGYGPYTRNAIRAWLVSKGYSASDTLTREQAVELVTEGLRRRDEFGWALLIDEGVGFSVGLPTKLLETQPPKQENGAWWYEFKGTMNYSVAVLPAPDGCTELDGYYAHMLKTDGSPRDVTYQARKDDWFIVAGESGGFHYYMRAQCRRQGIVSVIARVPSTRIEALSFLFTAMSNSLLLRPTLNAQARPAPRLEYPSAAPGVTASVAPLAAPIPRASFDVDRSGKAASVKLTLTDGAELRPAQVFERVADAVYVVRSDSRQGSAVAVSERELLTNCHVVGTRSVVTLEREGQQANARLISANPDADRCVLASDAPLRRWVKVRPYADVKIGERVFTVGAPKDLELTLGEGIISSKRSLDGTRLLQTSAPISQGSSGGGLFDAQGNLIGITTFLMKDAQNLNFAIAAEEYAK